MRIIAKQVEAVAWFKSGTKEPIPLKFRIQNRDKTFSVIKIDKVISTEKSKDRIYSIRCQGKITGKDRTFTLKFNLNTQHWSLFSVDNV